jgi:arsenate reductase (thioredoxin)
MLKPKVLFLCTGNSARSQMAEAFLRDMAGDRFEALSAGITPRGLHPLAVEVMREIGIDISQQQSKDVRGFLGTPIPYIVTVCDNAKEHCPIFPGTYKYMHWSFEDPAVAGGRKIKNSQCSGVFGMRLRAPLSVNSQARHKQLN